MKPSLWEIEGFQEDVFELLDLVFPGIRDASDHARRLGAPWESVSTPYVFVENDRIISHIGVIGLPLVLLGRPVTVGSVHAVATHPDYRRRGHYGRLMEQVLRECEARYETLILTTEQPAHYEPFGFRVVQEHIFTVQSQRTQHPADRRTDRWRRLDTEDSRDVALLHRLLETREPVSDVVGVVGETVVFCVNEGCNPLWYEEDLDVVVCLERQGARLRLFDIVGPSVPSLAALVARISPPVDEIVVNFAPDRLGAEVSAAPHVFDHYGPSHLMVRGPFDPENEAFSLPRSART